MLQRGPVPRACHILALALCLSFVADVQATALRASSKAETEDSHLISFPAFGMKGCFPQVGRHCPAEKSAQQPVLTLAQDGSSQDQAKEVRLANVESEQAQACALAETESCGGSSGCDFCHFPHWDTKCKCKDECKGKNNSFIVDGTARIKDVCVNLGKNGTLSTGGSHKVEFNHKITAVDPCNPCDGTVTKPKPCRRTNVCRPERCDKDKCHKPDPRHKPCKTDKCSKGEFEWCPEVHKAEFTGKETSTDEAKDSTLTLKEVNDTDTKTSDKYPTYTF